MGYNFNDELPIYLQIIELIKMRIFCKEYLPNQKIPSIRELSFELEVNPNTIQKALLELESIGLIYTSRTNGKFVTQDEKLISEIKTQTISNMIDEFCSSMKKIGISEQEITQIFIERSKK